jgi:hypothetical protein
VQRGKDGAAKDIRGNFRKNQSIALKLNIYSTYVYERLAKKYLQGFHWHSLKTLSDNLDLACSLGTVK